MSSTIETPIDISVVVPVYNSEKTLRPLTERLLAAFDTMQRSGEIIFVDDGSADTSWQVLEELTAEQPERVAAVQLTRNYGQHNALMCGFHEVRGRVVVTMDDDLQNPPEEMHKLVETLEAEGHDLVYARYGEKKHARWRNMGTRVVQVFYAHIFEHDIPPTSFRAFRAELLPNVLSYQLNFTYIDGLLNWITKRIGSVDTRHDERSTGRSGYRLSKLLLLLLNLFTNFSILPLQIVSLLGFSVAMLGFLGALYYLLLYAITQISVPGFATIIIALLVLGGLQMLALGIIGEYLGRMHLNVNRKPQFVVRERRSAKDLSALPLPDVKEREKEKAKS